MKIVLQRVSSCSVAVEGQFVAESMQLGILALIGFGHDDSNEKLPAALEKIIQMRIFSNTSGKFDLSLLDVQGDLTLVPQFTLFGDTSKGRRPEFFKALNPDKSRVLFTEFVNLAESRLGESKVKSGKFGADMKVAFVNEGPVTIIFEN